MSWSSLWHGQVALPVVLGCIAVTAVVTILLKLSGLRAGSRMTLSPRREAQVRIAAVGILSAMVVASAFPTTAHLETPRTVGILVAAAVAAQPWRRLPMWAVLVVAVVVTAATRAVTG